MAALDDHIRETVGRLLDSLRGRLESELGSAQDELVRAAEDASARIAAEAAERATAEARRDAEQQLTDARESAARDADEQRSRFTTELEELQRRLDDSQRQIEESQKQIEEGQNQIEEHQLEAAAARVEIETLKSDLEAAREQLDATRDDVEATLRDIETSRRDSDAVRREVSRLTGVLRAKDDRVAQASRLPDAVRALDDSATFGEVLEHLAIRAGREAGRAAVFLVKGERLRDWRTVGFDQASDSPRLDIEVSDSGLIAEAIRSGDGVHPREWRPVPEFARTEDLRAAAAWPVSVGGSVVAVLYADGPVADNSDEPYWPAFLDVLARYAGRVLEGITVRQAAGLMTGKASGMSVPPVSRQSSGSIQ